jgi:hypothetical protein
MLLPERVDMVAAVGGAYSTTSQSLASERAGKNCSEEAMVFVMQKGVMMNSSEPVVLSMLHFIMLDVLTNGAVWRKVIVKDLIELQQISTGERRKSMNPWFRKNLVLTWGYTLESLLEIVNLARKKLGLPPITLCQIWGLELQIFFDEYLTLRDLYLVDMPAAALICVLLPHPMALLPGYEHRLLDFTPELREKGRLGLQLIGKSIGREPADVYAPLGGKSAVLAGLRRLARSIVAKKFFDKETEQGRKNRRERSKALKAYYQTAQGKEMAKKRGKALKAFYATPQGKEIAKARGPEISIALRSYYSKSTLEGKARRLDQSNKMKALFDASTEEGKANKSKKSTEAKAREDPSNPSAKANIQHRLTAVEIASATRTADALAVATLLEAHVQKEHSDTMPAFLLTTWLSTMNDASPTKLQELKKKYCMLTKTDNATYTTLVKSLEPPNLETFANRHLHHDKKNNATVRTINTLWAQGHECGCPKAGQLGRILSYLYWKDRAQIQNDKRDTKKKQK